MPGPGAESVWDYPRPPRLEPAGRRIVVVFAGVTVADSTRALRVLETSHPPTYYLPPDEVDMSCLRAAGGGSYCEWKGSASYWDVVASGNTAQRAAWSYAAPSPPFTRLAGHLAFYCAAMDRCSVDGEVASPQPGGFYGGWVTSWVTGPYKGAPGTLGW